jgi:glucosamine--fructose-6-phosphate aminotransferase (isomerizing)
VHQPGFQADILREPAALATLLDRYAEPGGPLDDVRLSAARRVVLLGMGSSQFAAQTAAALLRGRGIDAHVELASAAAPFPPSADTLAIGISASGGSAETVEALARHHGTSRTIAVTNYPDGAIAEHADLVLELHAGVEDGGIACRSFQATVALLHLMAGVPTDALRPAVVAAQAIIDGRDSWLSELLAIVGDGPVYTIAPYERLSSALQSALMLREAPRIAADGCETGEWLHVDLYLTKHPGYRALLFTGSRYDPEVMVWARERASSIVAVGRTIEGAALHIAVPDDPLVAVLVETMVAELAASELWRRRLEGT